MLASRTMNEIPRYSSTVHGGGKRRGGITNHQPAVGIPGRLRPPLVVRLPLQSSSASRSTAGASGFLILSQWLTRPERWAEPRRFDTIPSHPREHACLKMISPSPSKCLLKAIPSPASRRRVASVSFRSSRSSEGLRRDALVVRGYLSEEDRDNGAALKKAIEGVLSDIEFELQSEAAERSRARV